MSILHLQGHTTPEARVLLKRNNDLFRFLRFSWNLRGDGSLYMTLDRKGDTVSSTFDNKSGSWSDEENKKKGFSLSYHTSGMVNPKRISGGATFHEPLFEISQLHSLVLISVPSVNRLDDYEKSQEDDSVIDVPDNTRLDFQLFIGPPNASPPGTLATIECTIFSIFVAQSKIPDFLLAGKDNHFIFVRPQGAFETIQVQPDAAFTRFHQTIVGHDGILVYGPNGAGEYLMVFAVPMRVPPRATIKIADPSLVAQIDMTKLKNNSLRYVVRDQAKRIIKTPTAIAELELDADL